MSDTPAPASDQPTGLLAPLLGHWYFQYSEQRIYLATGELIEVIRQEPPSADCRALVITDSTLTMYYEYTNGSPTGESGYSTTRNYIRNGNTLLITLPSLPDAEPMSNSIILLTAKQLVLLAVPKPSLGFAYEWEQGFIR